MKIRIIAAIALSLGLATAAFAENPAKGMPDSWKGPIGDTFFSDADGMMMRPQDDMSARWAALTKDQQAQVRADCEKMAMTDTDATASTSVKPKTGADSDRTGGGQGPDMASACDMVKSMK